LQIAGIIRWQPVSGGLSFSSRAMWETAAAMLPPADVPPTRKPLLGSAPRADAFSAAYIASAAS
jgi:hypothetical protein